MVLRRGTYEENLAEAWMMSLVDRRERGITITIPQILTSD